MPTSAMTNDSGSVGTLSKRFTPAATFDAHGGIVLPGLVNTHTHAAMVLWWRNASPRFTAVYGSAPTTAPC